MAGPATRPWRRVEQAHEPWLDHQRFPYSHWGYLRRQRANDFDAYAPVAHFHHLTRHEEGFEREDASITSIVNRFKGMSSMVGSTAEWSPRLRPQGALFQTL